VCLTNACPSPCKARSRLAASGERRRPGWTATSAACCTVGDRDGTPAAHPRDARRPGLLIMTAAGRALFAATPWPAAHGLGPAVLGWALVPSRVRELIGGNRARPLASHRIGQGRMAPPPAPTGAGAARAPHLPGHAPGRPGKAPQNGRPHPGRESPLALRPQRGGEVIAGAPTAVTPRTVHPGPLVGGAPGTHIGAVTPGTLARASVPPSRMEGSVAWCGTEAWVDRPEGRQRRAAPLGSRVLRDRLDRCSSLDRVLPPRHTPIN
jgi:hypothetical protein